MKNLFVNGRKEIFRYAQNDQKRRTYNDSTRKAPNVIEMV